MHGRIGKAYIGKFTDIKDPLEEENEKDEEKNIVEEVNDETIEDEEFGIHNIIH